MATLELDLGILPEGCTLSFSHAVDRDGFQVTLGRTVYNGWTEGVVTAEGLITRDVLLRQDRQLVMNRTMLGLLSTLRQLIAERTWEAPAPLPQSPFGTSS